MISSIKSLVILLGLSALSVSHDTKWVFETVSEGKVAPLLPEEYVTNFVQHKWDQDGFGVSHVSAGTIWHSFSRKIIRVDSAQHDWRSNNATIRGPRIGSAQISVFDFNRTDGQLNNLILNLKNMQTATCQNFTIPVEASSFQLLPKDALRLYNAGFSGQEEFLEYGLCDKWTVIFAGSIPATFYFTSAHQKWIGMDFTSPPPLKASVVTKYFNMDVSDNVFDPEVFEGIDGCTSFSRIQ